MFPGVLGERAAGQAAELVRRLGDRLGQEGYRGFFEVDVLVDVDSDEVYLGELNPRISGASAITNVTAGAYADVPLFLFHLLEYMDVDFELDVDEINERWEELAAVDVWSPDGDQGDVARSWSGSTPQPRPASTSLDDPRCARVPPGGAGLAPAAERERGFFLRVYGAGDYRWKGADLGVLVTKGGCRPRVAASRPAR